ncbi:MAG: competence/damage-inducible protein A [Oscillospiraceae bacterium]|nr:competence/damage-inducible protein A [Oscillospiraceae bacterium]
MPDKSNYGKGELMTAEIIAVGTELLLGAVANTDAMYISRELAAMGINVHHHSVVGDNESRLKAAVELAKTRADIIITSGGLGPTYDDMTKGAVAECFGLKLELHQPSFDKIRGYFEKLGRECTPNNEQQAWLPKGCTVLENSCGTAPGCAFNSGDWHVIMLPGPPVELRAMLTSGAIPYLEKLSDTALASRHVRFFGIGESALENELGNMMISSFNPTVAPYSADFEVYLRVTAAAKTREEAFSMTQPMVDKLVEMFPNNVYGVDVDNLEQTVSALLRERGKTVALAESCTGGLIAKRLTDIPGASELLWGSAVVYTNEAKTEMLGVPGELINKHGAVSEPVAIAMADGILAKSGADYALSVTGWCGAERSDCGAQKSGVCGANSGNIFIALAKKEGETRVLNITYGQSRERGRMLAAGHALKLLLDELKREKNT